MLSSCQLCGNLIEDKQCANLPSYRASHSIEPLLPPPTPVEMIEQLVAASQLSESAAERQSIQSVVLTRLDRDAASLPREWATATRATISAAIDADVRIERSYQAMIRRSVGQAETRARLGEDSCGRRAASLATSFPTCPVRTRSTRDGRGWRRRSSG